ncbi:hypothetical protein K0B03_02035 [Patescibacteria group bacterium]|nr:hypothetical protein [Patescibacteria group bacterium]
MLIPEICKADIVTGFHHYNSLITWVIMFLGVWVVEADVIFSRLKQSYFKVFLSSFVVNILTTLVGFYLAYYITD